jgi:hypothetical protein
MSNDQCLHPEYVTPSTLPPPIQTILTPEWYAAKEKYAEQIRASLKAQRLIMVRTEAARQQAREAEQREQEAIRAEYRRNHNWLTSMIAFDPEPIVQALGLQDLLTEARRKGGQS